MPSKATEGTVRPEVDALTGDFVAVAESNPIILKVTEESDADEPQEAIETDRLDDAIDLINDNNNLYLSVFKIVFQH